MNQLLLVAAILSLAAKSNPVVSTTTVAAQKKSGDGDNEQNQRLEEIERWLSQLEERQAELMAQPGIDEVRLNQLRAELAETRYQLKKIEAQLTSNLNAFTLESVAIAIPKSLITVGGLVGFSSGLRSGRIAHFRAGLTFSPTAVRRGALSNNGWFGILTTATLQFPITFDWVLNWQVGGYTLVDFRGLKNKNRPGVEIFRPRWDAGLMLGCGHNGETLTTSFNVGIGPYIEGKKTGISLLTLLTLGVRI